MDTIYIIGWVLAVIAAILAIDLELYHKLPDPERAASRVYKLPCGGIFVNGIVAWLRFRKSQKIKRRSVPLFER